MFGVQPSVAPLPSSLSFAGKTALVTGANVGLGFATSLQFLQHNLSTLLITVRSATKGAPTRDELLSDPIVKSLKVQPTISILECEFSDPKSVKALAEKIENTLDGKPLDYAILNAGVGTWGVERSAVTGQELMFQVNFASTALLALLLLPILSKHITSDSNSPARLTFVGSSAVLWNSIERRANSLASSSKPVFTQLADSVDKVAANERYGDSKLLLYMFVRELAKHVESTRTNERREVVVNVMCPGMVATKMERGMPFWTRPILYLFKGWRARPPEVGGAMVVYAASMLGSESQGQFIQHNKITELKATQFVEEKDGQKLQQRIWEEAMALTQPSSTS